MPGKKENYKRRKKSNARKKYRKYNQLIGTSGFPTQLYTKLKYTQTVQLNATSGTISTNVFSGNSCFDPDVSGTGHQPYFYDQLTSIYNSYCVFASKIHVVAGTNSSVDSRVVVRPAIPSTAVGNMDLECERPNCKCAYIKPEGTAKPLNHFAKSGQVFGSQSKKLDENFQAASSANPNNRWYWLVAAQATDSASTAVVQATVTITYYVRFFDRATVGSS